MSASITHTHPQDDVIASREQDNVDFDDDFDGEELGDRQVEACSLEPGCTWCE
ncbi:MAG: hypothetical protein AAF191_09555 [Verrucomicrobiota bacterium]